MEFEIGSIVEGKVKSITNFGAFIDFDDGKSGLVHISEISNTFVKDIKDHLKEGQTVKTKVISKDPSGKLGLSIKRIQEEKKPENNNDFGKSGGTKSIKKFVDSKLTSNRFEDMMAKFKQISDEKISSFTEKTKRRGNSRKANHRTDF